MEFEGFVRTDLLDELEFRVSEFEVRVHLAESNASSDQLLFAHKRACSRGSTRGQQEGAASSARVRALAQRERALRMAPRGEECLVRPTSLCPPLRLHRTRCCFEVLGLTVDGVRSRVERGFIVELFLGFRV